MNTQTVTSAQLNLSREDVDRLYVLLPLLDGYTAPQQPTPAHRQS